MTFKFPPPTLPLLPVWLLGWEWKIGRQKVIWVPQPRLSRCHQTIYPLFFCHSVLISLDLIFFLCAPLQKRHPIRCQSWYFLASDSLNWSRLWWWKQVDWKKLKHGIIDRKHDSRASRPGERFWEGLKHVNVKCNTYWAFVNSGGCLQVIFPSHQTVRHLS